MNKQKDIGYAFFFGILSLIFILLMVFYPPFFEWAWARHHNVWSWYIRPLMLLPFVFFAYQKSFAGMSFSIFALITSMAWFPVPIHTAPEAVDFLQMEKEYLAQEMTLKIALLWALVPTLFVLLGMAFWKRKFLYGAFVIIISGVSKMIWSVQEGGESGWLVVFVALIGILISLGVVILGHYLQKRNAKV